MSSVIWGQSTFEEKEQHYQEVLLAQAGITAGTGAERLKALRDMDGFALGRMAPALRHVMPYYGEDSHMFDRGLPLYMKQFEIISSCPWVEAIMIGSDQFEGSVIMPMEQGNNSATAVASIRAAMKDSPLIDQILAEYDDLSNETPWAAVGWVEFSRFLGDVYISEGTHTLAEALCKAGKKVFHYTFALSNPWPGSELWNVAGHHFVDILYVFLTLAERYPKRRDRFFQRQAEETARRWITFAYGEEPWAPYETLEGVSAVCDDISGWYERARGEDLRLSQHDPWGVRPYKATALIRQVWKDMEEKEGAEAVEAARKHWLLDMYARLLSRPSQSLI